MATPRDTEDTLPQLTKVSVLLSALVFFYFEYTNTNRYRGFLSKFGGWMIVVVITAELVLVASSFEQSPAFTGQNVDFTCKLTCI